MSDINHTQEKPLADKTTAAGHQPPATDSRPPAAGSQPPAAGAPPSGPVSSSSGLQPTAYSLQPDPNFTPKIIAYCCHYCAFTAADLAGSLRLNYSPSVTVIRLPCTGRADVALLLHAFNEGADGVYVAGCLDGDCHFLEGNFRAKQRVKEAKKILEEIGFGAERLEMYQISAAQGARFAAVADEFTARIAKLGPVNKASGNRHQASGG